MADPQSTDERRLRRLFELLDANGDGQISPEELIDVMKKHVKDSSKFNIDATLKAMRESGGTLDFETFAATITRTKPLKRIDSRSVSSARGGKLHHIASSGSTASKNSAYRVSPRHYGRTLGVESGGFGSASPWGAHSSPKRTTSMRGASPSIHQAAAVINTKLAAELADTKRMVAELHVMMNDMQQQQAQQQQSPQSVVDRKGSFLSRTSAAKASPIVRRGRRSFLKESALRRGSANTGSANTGSANQELKNRRDSANGPSSMEAPAMVVTDPKGIAQEHSPSRMRPRQMASQPDSTAHDEPANLEDDASKPPVSSVYLSQSSSQSAARTTLLPGAVSPSDSSEESEDDGRERKLAPSAQYGNSLQAKRGPPRKASAPVASQRRMVARLPTRHVSAAQRVSSVAGTSSLTADERKKRIAKQMDCVQRQITANKASDVQRKLVEVGRDLSHAMENVALGDDEADAGVYTRDDHELPRFQKSWRWWFTGMATPVQIYWPWFCPCGPGKRDTPTCPRRQTCAGCVNSLMHSLRFHPMSSFRRLLRALVIMTTVYLCVYIPLWAGMRLERPLGFSLVDIFTELVYLTEVVVSFFTCVILHGGEPETDFDVISKQYRQSWFIPDVISLLPLYYVSSLFISNDVLYLLDFNRLLRLFKLTVFLRAQFDVYVTMPFSRLATFFLYVAVYSHLFTCLWVYLALEDGPTWATKYGIDIDDRDTLYISSLHYTIVTFTSVGYGDIVPVTNVEKVVTIIITLFSNMSFSFLVANMTTLVGEFDALNSIFQRRMRAVNAFLQYNHVSQDLVRRVNQFYEFAFSRQQMKPFTEEMLLGDLPDSLRSDVSFSMNVRLLRQVPIFEGQSELFLRRLTSRFHAHVFAPGDIVFEEGDPGESMYFVRKGVVEVYTDKGDDAEKSTFALLSDGDVFGEVALLLGSPRTASVRSVTHTDLYILDKADLDEVLTVYPEVALGLKAYVDEHHYKYNEDDSYSDFWGELEELASAMVAQRDVSQEPLLAQKNMPREPSHEDLPGAMDILSDT